MTSSRPPSRADYDLRDDRRRGKTRGIRGERSFIESLQESDLYSMGAFFCDQHPRAGRRGGGAQRADREAGAGALGRARPGPRSRRPSARWSPASPSATTRRSRGERASVAAPAPADRGRDRRRHRPDRHRDHRLAVAGRGRHRSDRDRRRRRGAKAGRRHPPARGPAGRGQRAGHRRGLQRPPVHRLLGLAARGDRAADRGRGPLAAR